MYMIQVGFYYYYKKGVAHKAKHKAQGSPLQYIRSSPFLNLFSPGRDRGVRISDRPTLSQYESEPGETTASKEKLCGAAAGLGAADRF